MTSEKTAAEKMGADPLVTQITIEHIDGVAIPLDGNDTFDPPESFQIGQSPVIVGPRPTVSGHFFLSFITPGVKLVVVAPDGTTTSSNPTDVSINPSDSTWSCPVNVPVTGGNKHALISAHLFDTANNQAVCSPYGPVRVRRPS